MIATWKTLTMTVTLQTLKQLTAASTKQYSSNQGISLTKHSTKTKTSSKATMKPSSNSSRRGKNVFKPDISARRDELMCDFLESTIAKKKRAHEDNGEHIEKLAKQFQNIVLSLSRNRVQAAFTCPKFNVFLTPEEWPLLRQYKKAMKQAYRVMESDSSYSHKVNLDNDYSCSDNNSGNLN